MIKAAKFYSNQTSFQFCLIAKETEKVSAMSASQLRNTICYVRSMKIVLLKSHPRFKCRDVLSDMIIKINVSINTAEKVRIFQDLLIDNFLVA